jgi:hypothetical protein
VTAQAPTSPGTRTLRSPQYLEGTDVELFAPVYAACSARGHSGPEVDDMEVWQVASALEIDMGDDKRPAGSSDAPPAPGSLSRSRRR